MGKSFKERPDKYKYQINKKNKGKKSKFKSDYNEQSVNEKYPDDFTNS
jgi:hypothetical protein